MTTGNIRSRLMLGAAMASCLLLAGHAEARAGGFCTQTADTLLDACKASVSDDSAVHTAICINISDRSDRDACLAAAAAEEDQSNVLCTDQHSTRVDACAVLGEDRYDPDFSPARFDHPKRPSNPNPYFPVKVGYRWEYRSQTQVDKVEVVNETKLIAGVKCIVIRDHVFEDGLIHEATDDWYASAKDGSVWYFGEEVKDYETFEGDRPLRPELVSIDGSFKAGVAGAKPGIIALASPRTGDAYLEEFSLGNAEDVTEILSTTYSYGSDAELDHLVPRALARRFCAGDCVVTKNYSMLEPGLFARKYFARGIGTILEVENTGEVVQLVSCNFDGRCANLPKP